MQSSQSSTDTEKRRPRGDMYLRAEQRQQAEAAAARLTEILTPPVSAVYDAAATSAAPIAPAPPPAMETLATTTSVAGGTDGLVAPPPSTAGLDLSFIVPPAHLSEALLVPPAVVAAAAAADVAPVIPVAAVTPAAAPAETSVAQPAVADVVRAPEGVAAPFRIVNPPPARSHRRRALQSLVPASAFVVVALAALFAIAATLWPSNPEAAPNAGPARNKTAAPATRADVAATPASPATPGPDAGPSARGPAYSPAPVAANGTATNLAGTAGRPGLAEQARRPDLTNQARRLDITAPARPSAPVQQARADVAPDRPAAVTPVHTASEGELRITSTPSGARVTVNGIGWGQTPLTLAHLPLGPKTVRVTQDGYASQQRVVDLRGDTASAAVHVALRPAE